MRQLAQEDMQKTWCAYHMLSRHSNKIHTATNLNPKGDRKKTWCAGDDVYTFLQSPGGLLGVGAPNQQLTPQLGRPQVLLETAHEVMRLLCKVLAGFQDDSCGLAVFGVRCCKVFTCITVATVL